MSARRYILDIYNRGVTSTTGTIAYTFKTSQFADVPLVRTQIVRAKENVVESQPWAVRVLDTNQQFTAILGDSSGRMQLLGRLARLRSSLDSTASSNFSNMAVARFTDLQMAGDVATYDCTFSDERWIERQTQVFAKANTAMLVPVGLINDWYTIKATPAVNWKVEQVTGTVVRASYYGNTALAPSVFTTRNALQIIIDDVRSDAIGGSTTVNRGNFNTTRFHDSTNSTDREVVSFDTITSPTGAPVPIPAHTFVDSLQSYTGAPPTSGLGRFMMWIYWPTSQPSVGALIKGYLYAPTHPPTNELPLHIGGIDGKRPATLAKELYQGTYSGTTTLSVRYSTASMASWENDPADAVAWWRITQPFQMDQFLDDHIYGPYSRVPFVDSSGKIAPISLRLPHSSAVNPANLTKLGSSNLLSHPTFEHPSDEIVNAIRVEYQTYTRPLVSSTVTANQFFFGEQSIDRVKVSTAFVDRTHDSINNIGRRERRFQLAGAVSKSAASAPPTTGTRIPTIDEIADSLAANIFPRFGDGPIYSQMDAMQLVDTSTNGRLLQGRYVKLAVGTQPNPAVNARGSTRLMQIMERQDRVNGPSFRLLDVGPNLNALLAPGLTLAQSTRDTRHAVVGTISSLPAGAFWEAQLAITTTGTTSAPATISTKWFPVFSNMRLPLSSTTFTRGQLPSKSKIWGRARAFKFQRIGSNWSAAASVVTASITAPSGFAVSNLTGGTATFKWSNGSTLYPIQVMVDASSVATLGTSNVVASVAAGTTRYDIAGLNKNDTQKGGVRHFDLFGGVSGQSNATFTTTTSFGKPPKPFGFFIAWGA